MTDFCHRVLGSKRVTLRCSALVLGVSASLSGPAWAQNAAPVQPAFERIQARGSVIIGHRESSIPLSYLADGKPVGYSLDLCGKVAEAIGRHLKMKDLKVQYQMVTSANRLELVERGEVDLECGSTTNTAVRRQKVAFSIPHFVASSRLMVKSNTSYDRLEDLNGRKIASTKGTTNIDSLAREARVKSLTVEVVPTKDHAEGMAWVLEGKADAFAMDDVLLYGLRANAPKPEDLKIIGKPITIEPYAIAFERNNPALKQVVDAEMRRLITSRELHQFYDRWFTKPIPPKGINLDMRMPHLLQDSLKYPSDFVPN